MADKKKQGGGDAPPPAKKAKTEVVEPEEPQKTVSEIVREEAEYRSMMRKQKFKRRWPEVTKPKLRTRPWQPPGPPQKMPRVTVELPELTVRKWVPPYRRRRRPRRRLMRIPAEEVTQPLYEYNTLKKIWHGFSQVEKNKMMLQGSIGCDSKRYSSTACGAQTACIAVVCRALLDEKTPADLVRRDVDEVIDAGDRYYRQCMLAMKCYKGKPQLNLNQLLTSFFFHDNKCTVKMMEMERGLLAKHPDNIQSEQDLMALMEKKIGSTYMMILSIGGERHFLIWGHPPPPEAGSSCRTVCYIFDPHMLNDQGQPNKLGGAGAFLRYPGVTSFVLDFLANYGDLDLAKKGVPKPLITLTNIDVVQKEPLLRVPDYGLDLKALKIHCRSEWDSMNKNALIEKKRTEGLYPLGCLSAISLATSRGTTRRKVRDFYQKTPKEPPPVLPLAPERAPPSPTLDQIMALRGEDFFLFCPRADGHNYGRDDMIPPPKEEPLVHSPVEVADKSFHSQFQQLDAEKWILRGTRHMASFRYQTFKTYSAIPCCVAAIAMLRRLRARGWNEDTVDETLDLGYNLYRESLVERGGPIRRIVLGEVKDCFRIRDKEYCPKRRGIAVWGKLVSSNPKVFDLCRGIEAFFKEGDSGILQVPGEYECAIWNEGGRYYLYHPWPADKSGRRVSLQGGGRACLMYFTRITALCDHFMENVTDMKMKPFAISDVSVFERSDLPEPVNKMKPIAPNRWVVRGRFHEADSRFPEDHRGKQATPASIAAIAMAHIVESANWTADDIDETLIRGDILYQNTMDHLERMGISLETPKGEEAMEEEEEIQTGILAAADVLNKFRVTDFDCIETDVMDGMYSGKLNAEKGSGVMSLKESLKSLFSSYRHAVVTARGGSTAVWYDDDHLYFFDPHGCDENGASSGEPRAAAALVRLSNNVEELANIIMGNLAPGQDDSFNISPVTVTAAKLNPELGAPQTKLDNKEFQWIAKGSAAIMMGPRGENSALGKAAEKAGIGEDDMAGRTLALPAAAAFCAATDSVPPPHMHKDHMFNFIDAGTEYYLNHMKKTGRKDIQVEDLTEKFEMGANTFSIELGEPVKLPLRLPDEPAGEGEEGGEKEELGEGEEEKEVMKQIKDALFKQWSDQTKPATVSLLVGDYHQLGVWVSAGGKVVAFDAAPTLTKGMLTRQRIMKGDELRLQRIKDEMAGEGGGDEEEDDEEAGGEGEAVPEPEPQFVPPESCPVLMVFASPAEFIDKLTLQGPLDRKQCLAPYKLYPVTITNELTTALKDKKPGEARGGEEEDESEALIEPLSDAAMGTYFTRIGRATASLRGKLAQGENYFVDEPNRDNQDAATAVMGIVVEHIEPYTHWKSSLIDAIVKYGDRLYTLSLPKAEAPPRLAAREVVTEFHVTTFNVRLEIDPDCVIGDIKAGDTGGVLNVKRAINKFFETGKYGVLCCKHYCVAFWKAADDKAVCLWEPHAVGPAGLTSPSGAAGLTLFSTVDLLADAIKKNVETAGRSGPNTFSISGFKVFWEISKTPQGVTAQGAAPDEGYEWKVLTAYVETARGRTILRGSRPPDLVKFTRDALLQSSCGAIVAACMSHVRRPHLWTRNTVDEVMAVGCQLFGNSLGSLGYEFRPGDDVLLPLQVLKRYVLGVNYVRYDLQSIYSGKLEQKEHTGMTVRSESEYYQQEEEKRAKKLSKRSAAETLLESDSEEEVKPCALERFFESHTHGVLWSMPHAVAVWHSQGAPPYYMMEPHACGPTGLRIDAQDDGAACVLTFSSAKLMAFGYLQNIPVTQRPKHEFQLYAISVVVSPIKPLGCVMPPIVKAPPGVKLVPATSKVGIDGAKRRAAEGDRKHPPGSATCLDAQRASEKRDKEHKLKGLRNTSGWLVLQDGTQFLSAHHSMACRKFPYASRGFQALACAVMAVAMSRVEDVCRWCSSNLDEVLESGDQLYQDSYLHFKPPSKILNIQQILRKFYTPGNCVCRVVVYRPRQKGTVDTDLLEQLSEFFREERAGVFVAGKGDFAVALFRTPRGFYMFDPADRDRYGRAVAPPCTGKARACFSQYPNVKSLAEKLGPNIPPVMKEDVADPEVHILSDKTKSHQSDLNLDKEVHFEEPATFTIYGMDVTGLRRLNQHER